MATPTLWNRPKPPQSQTFPKDSAVLKILRRSKFTMRSKFTIAQWFAMATPPPCAHTIFLGFAGIFPLQEGVHGVVNMGGIVKTLRRSNSLSRSIFSTAVSFGLFCQARKKGTQTHTFESGYFLVGWGSSMWREAKKFGTSLSTREIKHFWRDIPGFCRDISGVPEKFEKKKVCVQFWAPI